jgi:hypothetical protein
MKPISHKQARGWIQQRLDGQFDEHQAAALAQHLQSCAACRGFAARLEQLDAELRQGYRAQTQNIAVSQIPLPDGAISTLQEHMRLKMKNGQVKNFTTSFAFIAAMLALALGLSWLGAAQSGVNPPGSRGDATPAPTATATPFPWTKDAPLTDPEQVVAILETLAQKNVAAFQQTAWVHTIRQDPGQPGTVPTTASDSWFQYPRDDQTCIAGMEIVAQELGGTPLQIFVTRAGGTFGDLLQLRKGNEPVTYLQPGEYGCSLKPEFTEAGVLAQKVAKEQAGATEKMELRAWYETVDAQVTFNVAATFTLPAKDNYAGINKETYRFADENGLVLWANMWAERVDGGLFAESTQAYVTEFAPALPAEVAVAWKEYSGELQAYANGTAPAPTAVATSRGDPVSVVEDQQYISPADPLTDGQTILQILDALERLQIRRLSQPGWYIYGPKSVSAEHWLSNRYILVHTIDESGACDYMSYYIKDGKILPQEIVLADGRWGTIGSVENGQLTAGEKGKIGWDNGPQSATCQIPNVEPISYLRNETQTFRDLVDGQTKATFKGWTEQIGGRKFFVLYTNLELNGFGTVMDPATGKLEPIERQETWLYFDLDWGAVLEAASVQVFHLQNGGTLGAAPTPEKTIAADYTFYKALPDDLQAAYAKIVTDLAALYP